MDAFLEVIERFQDRVVIMLGAHVHSGEIRAPLSFLNKGLTNLTVMMTPGVAPIFNNNPGYTIMDVDPSSQLINDLSWRFFQL
jgi:hypothetical protein